MHELKIEPLKSSLGLAHGSTSDGKPPFGSRLKALYVHHGIIATSSLLLYVWIISISSP
jgi:hypothetical protein